MIEFNLVLHNVLLREEIQAVSDSIEIMAYQRLPKVQTDKGNIVRGCYFHIRADEEVMTFFKLKYGSENVWKR